MLDALCTNCGRNVFISRENFAIVGGNLFTSLKDNKAKTEKVGAY